MITEEIQMLTSEDIRKMDLETVHDSFNLMLWKDVTKKRKVSVFKKILNFLARYHPAQKG